jgi:hypothetical protein
MAEFVMRKIDGKMKMFKKIVKKHEDKEEEKKGEVDESPKEEKAEEKEHEEHPEFSKKIPAKIAHDHLKKGKGGGCGTMAGKGGGLRHGKKAKKLSFMANTAKKWHA